MSFTNSEMNRAAHEALQRQGVALKSRWRQNLFLRIVALVSAIMLYVFVQTERNPVVTRSLVLDVVRDNLPEKMDVEGLPRQLSVSLTGPRFLVQSLTPADIRASVDFQGFPPSATSTQRVLIGYRIPAYTRDMVQQLTFDPPNPSYRVQLYPQATRPLNVRAITSKEAPFGSHYGKPEITPAELSVSGRRDQVAKVARLVVMAFAADPNSSIDGDFPVLAQDSDGNTVENVSLSQAGVHVVLPLKANPPSKIVFVSPRVTEVPALPAIVEGTSLSPLQIKVTGGAAQIERMNTVLTEPISLRDFTQDHDMDVTLDLPEGVKAESLSGKPVKTVHIHFNIGRAKTPPPAPTVPDTTIPQGGSAATP